VRRTRTSIQPVAAATAAAATAESRISTGAELVSRLASRPVTYPPTPNSPACPMVGIPAIPISSTMLITSSPNDRIWVSVEMAYGPTRNGGALAMIAITTRPRTSPPG
jgi:hypothetical protein